MNCYKCGAKVSEEARFCGVCGNPIKSMTELVEEGRNGDQQALGELYCRTKDKVYFTLRGLCKDEDTAQDILHDSYLNAFKNLDHLKNPENFQAWIKTIAINTAKNWFKKKKPMLFSQVADDEDEEFDPVAAIADDYLDHQPEEMLDQQETKRLLREIVDSLSEEQRIAVTLYYYEEWDIKSIAEHVGCSEGTIKSRLNYGRKKIEEAVLTLEKKGTKLYGLAPIPFFLWLLRGEEVQAAVTPAASVLGSILADLGKNAAAQAAGSAAAQTVSNAGTHAASQTAANAGTQAASQSVASTGTQAATNTGIHAASQTAANAGAQAAAHTAATTAANTAAHAAAAAAVKGGAAAVGKGMAAKLAAVVIGGVVIGGGATAGTITYIEKTNERQQQEAAETMNRQEELPEEIPEEIPEAVEEPAAEEDAWEIRDDLLDNLGEEPETPPEEPEAVVDIVEATPVPEEPTPEPTATPEPTEAPDPLEAKNKAARKAYKKVQKEIRLLLGNEIRNTEWRNNGDALAAKYPHMNIMPFIDYNWSPAGHDLYYYYYDIDHNGIDELLLSYCQGDGVMDIYTFDGENAKSIQNVGPAFAYRCVNMIFTDGTIYEYASGSAFNGGAYFYKLTDDGYSVVETMKREVCDPEYAAEYGYTDYITNDELDGILSQYEEVTNLKWKVLEPITEEAEDTAAENTAPVDVTAEYADKVSAFMEPFDWYLAWQNSDFVFDDYSRSSMVCQAVNGMIGMGYEEVRARCEEPMKRYFGPDAKFVLKEAAEYTGTSSLYMYQMIGGKLNYMYGNELCNLIGVADNIQKIGSDTYQVKFDYYYAHHEDDIAMGYADPNFREYMISYDITLKESDTGFIITDMKLL